jgi:hypothetical protein
MTLSPMEPNVITNSCKGGVSLQFRALGVKCEEMGFKNPSNAFYSKVAARSAQAQISENIISSLKCLQAGIFVFNGRGFFIRQDRWSSGVWGHEVARGLTQSRGR